MGAFGEKLADCYVDLGWIHDFGDIYALDWYEVASWEGLGEKNAENLEKSVEASKIGSAGRTNRFSLATPFHSVHIECSKPRSGRS